MKQIKFVAIEADGWRDGSNGWEVHVNGEKVVDRIMDTDIADARMQPVFKMLGIAVDFDYDI